MIVTKKDKQVFQNNILKLTLMLLYVDKILKINVYLMFKVYSVFIYHTLVIIHHKLEYFKEIRKHF